MRVELAGSNSGHDHLVVDMVFIYDAPSGNDWRLFETYRAAGVDFVQCHPAGDDHNVSQAVQRLAAMRRDVRRQSDTCILVESVADIHRAKREGKLGVGIQFEGFRCLERNLDMVDLFYDLGVRLCHPVFNITNSIGGGCADGDTIGLTSFGRRVIARMNAVGMIVDGAHAGYATQRDMLEISATPVVCSHHGIDRLHPHFRNIKDDIIKLCASRGGVIGISGAGFYLGGQPSADLLFRHIDYVVQMVGPEHAGFSLDWAADTRGLEDAIVADPDAWPGGGDYWSPMSFGSPALIRPTVDRMLGAGYDEPSVAAILGGNWLRVASGVWK